MRRARRWLLGLAGGAMLAPWPMRAAFAQADWRQVAVPAYGPRDLVAGFWRGHALPRARAWQRACAVLVEACGPAGGDDAARSAWRETALAWAALSAVTAGPLLARRSARRVDFHPVRVPLLQRAIAQAPSGAAAMERIGSPAKGLAALEWLLWSADAPRDAAARAYRLELAHDLRREADAVVSELEATASAEPDDEAIVAAFAEILNQWIGGLEQLRLPRLLRPVEEAVARGARAPVATRPLARLDAAERAARWQALSALALFDGAVAPAIGSGALVPFESLLRGRGLNPLADRLRASTIAAGAAVEAAGGDASAAMRRAAQAVGALERLAEAEIAPALDVRIGFSDADGD